MRSEGARLGFSDAGAASPFVWPSEAPVEDVTAHREGYDGYEAVFQASELSEFEPPYLAEDEAQPADSVSARVVSIARAELARWNPSPKIKRMETDPGMRDALRAYWGAVVSAKEVESRINNGDAWSAAFISWVIAQAGAGSAFQYSAAHRIYVSAAKAAREAADRSRYWAYRVSEVSPEPGDIVCRDRQSKKGAPCNGATYENINDGTQWATHGDVVVTLRKGKIDVIGGNLDDSVGSYEIALDANHRLVQPAGCKYFAILKPPAATADVVGGARSEGNGSVLAPIATAIRSGSLPIEVGLAIAAGNRNESELTNLVFYAQHPEVPAGQKINASERALVQDWLRIRDQVVRPLLRQLPGG